MAFMSQCHDHSFQEIHVGYISVIMLLYVMQTFGFRKKNPDRTNKL